MATAPTQTSSAQRAQLMRQAWQPVRQRLSAGAGSTFDFLTQRPALAQGTYYLLVGLWPWIGTSSFLWITGERTDLWLAQTVGALICIIGAVLCVAAYDRNTSRPIVCLALGSAVVLALVEVIFVLQEKAPRACLLDAILQVAAVALWARAWRNRRAQPLSTGPVNPAPLAQRVAG